jgi:hypothetical protein
VKNRIGALLATVPSNGSTNQSDFGFEEMVRTFLLCMFQERGVFRIRALRHHHRKLSRIDKRDHSAPHAH